jgi:hypothetical protein
MDNKIIETGLKQSALTPERTRALVEAGIPGKIIAQALRISGRTFRNWGAGATEPQPHAGRRLDDLRFAMSELVEHGLKPEQAADWMQGLNGEPPFYRPIDVIAEEPERVFGLIAVFAESFSQ